MGTLLILAPAGADYLYQRNVVALRAQAPSANETVIERMNNWYRFGCWFPGGLMLIIGIIGAAAAGRPADYVEDDDDEDEDEEGNGK
jgi:hypothetical protein